MFLKSYFADITKYTLFKKWWRYRCYERCFKTHGCRVSENVKGGYIKDYLKERLAVSLSLKLTDSGYTNESYCGSHGVTFQHIVQHYYYLTISEESFQSQHIYTFFSTKSTSYNLRMYKLYICRRVGPTCLYPKIILKQITCQITFTASVYS